MAVMQCDINNNVFFRKIAEPDISLLYSWFKQPHVSEWWPVPDGAEFFHKFLERIRSKNTFAYLVSEGDVPFGYIQYYYLDVTKEKVGKQFPALPDATIGIDQFVGDPMYLGKGYGTKMIKAFIEYIREIEPKVTTVIVDPEPKNEVAIRCYKKVGFQEVGTYETSYGMILLMRIDISEKQ